MTKHPTGGHRDIDQTSCPGNKLYAEMDYLRTPWEDDMSPEDVEKIVRDLLGVNTNEKVKEIGDAGVGLADAATGDGRPITGIRGEVYDLALLPGPPGKDGEPGQPAGPHTHPVSVDTETGEG